jgi:hypothetical protein
VGISEIIVNPGLINVDFADVRSVMGNAGTAMMGVGSSTGKERAREATIAALSSPLLDMPLGSARGVVFTVLGPPDLSLSEVQIVADLIYETVSAEANIIFGASVDASLDVRSRDRGDAPMTFDSIHRSTALSDDDDDGSDDDDESTWCKETRHENTTVRLSAGGDGGVGRRASCRDDNKLGRV